MAVIKVSKAEHKLQFDTAEALIEKLPRSQQAEYRRWLSRLKKRQRSGKAFDRSLQKCITQAEKALHLITVRTQSLPKANLNQQLPIYERREALIDAIQTHQVVVIAGETGSGKTTQLPQLCLLAGRGLEGLIGHTQPRRLAARSVAARIAEEVGVSLGSAVGYQVRFDAKVSEHTSIKLMTDGILLNELHDDPLLEKYDTLIIDEAHERSLNIDFILGLLKSILQQRHDLKLIITSATIDLDKFSRHFDDAPILEVSGRTYPVEVRYRTVTEYPQAEHFEALALMACRELLKEGPGDILVFLPTEQAIRHLADYLRRHLDQQIELLPLYARLAQRQQMLIFSAHQKSRIILSTNIAETSLTVPGIRYVIDSGTARISRYSTRSKVQRLPIEAISQASANQRMGRCGRLQNGICIRLYSEDDFISRPEYIVPEILRTNLASVILQMMVLELGTIEQFEFIDAPEQKQINDGIQTLRELGAITEQREITSIGTTLAKLPVDPRIGRILIAGESNKALREIIIIAAAIGLADPRERPVEAQQKADQYHQRFNDSSSDFLGQLKLWNYFHDLADELSWGQIRKRCKSEFIHYNRMREWREQVAQLQQLMKSHGYRLNDQPADYDAIHRALLAGYITQVAERDPRGYYLAPRQIKLQIFPGSSLFRRQSKKPRGKQPSDDSNDKAKFPSWIMAAEWVETSQVYARLVAKIQPDWIEITAKDLLKHKYSEPYWSTKQARALVNESASLYGLVIYGGRAKALAGIDPIDARQWFVRHGLVAKGFKTQSRALLNNWAVLEEIERLEEMSRRRDLSVSNDWLFHFYDQRLPDTIHNGPAFDRWYQSLSSQEQGQLEYQQEDICGDEMDSHQDDFPTEMIVGIHRIELDYVFRPGASDDGLHVHLPLVLVNQVTQEDFDWLVPGLIEDKLTALIRGLDKPIRKQFVPVPNTVSQLLNTLNYGEGIFLDVITKALQRLATGPIGRADLDAVELATNLRPLFIIYDTDNEVLSKGRDLVALQQSLDVTVHDAIQTEQQENILLGFPVTGLEPELLHTQGGNSVCIFQGLCAVEDGYLIQAFDSKQQAERSHFNALIDILIKNKSNLIKEIRGYVKELHKLEILYLSLIDNPYSRGKKVPDGLFYDLIAVKVSDLLSEGAMPYQIEAFEQLEHQLAAEIIPFCIEKAPLLNQIFSVYQTLRKRLDKPKDIRLLSLSQTLMSRLNQLVHSGFLFQAGSELISQYPRYLKSLEQRLETGLNKPELERQRAVIWEKYWNKYLQLEQADAIEATRPLMEEFHIALFAQQLGTKLKVSEKRLNQHFKAWPV